MWDTHKLQSASGLLRIVNMDIMQVKSHDFMSVISQKGAGQTFISMNNTHFIIICIMLFKNW